MRRHLDSHQSSAAVHCSCLLCGPISKFNTMNSVQDCQKLQLLIWNMLKFMFSIWNKPKLVSVANFPVQLYEVLKQCIIHWVITLSDSKTQAALRLSQCEFLNLSYLPLKLWEVKPEVPHFKLCWKPPWFLQVIIKRHLSASSGIVDLNRSPGHGSDPVCHVKCYFKLESKNKRSSCIKAVLHLIMFVEFQPKNQV